MAINSLGLGSGVLTSDVLDQLKENDRSIQVNPIDKKIDLNKKKSEALSVLDSLMTTFRSSASALGDSTLYQKRVTDASGSAVSVEAQSGVSVQNFSLEVTALAKKDIIESNTFDSKSAKVADSDGVLTIDINGKSLDVSYTANTTLEELSQAINDAAGESVKSKVLEIGSGDFRLVLTSRSEGQSNNITLNDDGGLKTSPNTIESDTSDSSKWGSVQEASDSEFKYDGISLSRSSNSVEDLITGVTLSFNEVGSSNISIKQDQEAITTEMKTMTEAYNAMQDQLDKLTTSDVEEGTVGLFNGDNTIKGINREINKVLTAQDSNGMSIIGFGFDMNRSGKLSFDSNKFMTKFNEDTKASEQFFSGGTVINSNGSDTYKNGAFNNLKDKLDNYISTKGSLTAFSTQLTEGTKTYEDDKTRAIKLLNQRYDTMTQRFIAYDSLISKLNNQFSTLQQQISMAVNGTNN